MGSSETPICDMDKEPLKAAFYKTVWVPYTADKQSNSPNFFKHNIYRNSKCGSCTTNGRNSNSFPWPLKRSTEEIKRKYIYLLGGYEDSL